jgi:septum formation protein
MKLVLASESEWRKKLMALLQLPFEVVPAQINEQTFEWEEPSEVVATLATLKAEAVGQKLIDARVFGAETLEGTVVVGADTVVAVGDAIIGKPENRESAKKIIEKLAGKMHEVWTGLCVLDIDTKDRVVEVEKTVVSFLPMTEKDLEKFLDSNDWMGKAGAYQVQGAIKKHVKDIEGSYTNVIGLPMLTLVEMLEKMGVWVEGDMEERLTLALGRPN